MRWAVVILAATTLLAGCVLGSPEEEEHYVSSDKIEVLDPSNPGGKKKKRDEGKALVPIRAGDGSMTEAVTSTTIAIDGQACVVTSAGLETGIDTRGWTMRAQGSCPLAFTLSISGVSDQRYPQTNQQPFRAEEGALLSMANASSQVADAFSASAGGNVSITAGPTSATKATVRGSATVVDLQGGTSHTVQFESAY